MAEEAGQTRAAALLREYLASRDISCEACGYNLRGAQDVFCPECGVVIPRPPAEYVARSRTDRTELKLACWDCAYVVTGVDAERCPECGGRKLQRFTGNRPPARFRIPWLPRNLPLLLTANAGISVMMVILAISMALQRGSSAAAGAAAALIGGLLSSAPIVIACLWLLFWPRLRMVEHGPRRLISTGLFVLGLLLVVGGIRVMG